MILSLLMKESPTGGMRRIPESCYWQSRATETMIVDCFVKSFVKPDLAFQWWGRISDEDTTVHVFHDELRKILQS